MFPGCTFLDASKISFPEVAGEKRDQGERRGEFDEIGLRHKTVFVRHPEKVKGNVCACEDEDTGQLHLWCAEEDSGEGEG